jgi:hypothetical protein
MARPSLSFQVVNPGATQRRVNTDQVPIYFGVAESGDLATIKTVGRESAAASDLTRGHLLDTVRHAFACGAKEVHYCRLSAAVAGSLGTQAAEGTPLGTLAISGTLSSRMRVRVEITGAGANGVATFRYSLDYFEIDNIDPTWSVDTLVPADGTHTPDGTALVLTFDDTGGDHAVGDAWTQDVYPGHYTATEIAALLAVIQASAPADANVLCFAGETPPGVSNAGSTAANTIVVAINALQASLFAAAEFFAIAAGTTEASAASLITATAATIATPPLVSIGHGKGYSPNPSPTPARGMMALDFAGAVVGSRIAQSLISTDPGRTASGPLPRIVATTYDSRLEGGALEAARISTFTTYQRRLSPGVFVCRMRLLDGPLGDFYSWQDAAIMVAALRAVHPVAWLAVLEGFRQKANGTLDETEAVSLDQASTRALQVALMSPLNVRGIPGHVTNAIATASRSTVLPEVQVDFAIQRLGYAEDLTFTLQYAAEV